MTKHEAVATTHEYRVRFSGDPELSLEESNARVLPGGLLRNIEHIPEKATYLHVEQSFSVRYDPPTRNGEGGAQNIATTAPIAYECYTIWRTQDDGDQESELGRHRINLHPSLTNVWIYGTAEQAAEQNAPQPRGTAAPSPRSIALGGDRPPGQAVFSPRHPGDEPRRSSR